MRAEVPFPSFWVTFWTAPPTAIGAKLTFDRICTLLKANNRLIHRNTIKSSPSECQIALLLNLDLAGPALDGMFPTALTRGHDG